MVSRFSSNEDGFTTQAVNISPKKTPPLATTKNGHDKPEGNHFFFNFLLKTIHYFVHSACYCLFSIKIQTKGIISDSIILDDDACPKVDSESNFLMCSMQ